MNCNCLNCNWIQIVSGLQLLELLLDSFSHSVSLQEILRNVAASVGLLGANAAAREYFGMALSMDASDPRTLFKFANFADARCLLSPSFLCCSFVRQVFLFLVFSLLFVGQVFLCSSSHLRPRSFQLEEAEGLYLSSLECSPPSPHRLCTYADFLLAGKRNARAAIACYEECLRLCPQHGEAAHNLALVLSDSDPSRAALLFDIALRHCSDALARAKVSAFAWFGAVSLFALSIVD